MDVFFGKEFAAEVLLHDVAVFENGDPLSTEGRLIFDVPMAGLDHTPCGWVISIQEVLVNPRESFAACLLRLVRQAVGASSYRTSYASVKSAWPFRRYWVSG